MHTINDVHQQFADFFGQKDIQPFIYLLSQKMEEGSICLDMATTISTQKTLLPAAYLTIPLHVESLHRSPLVGEEGMGNKPFVLDKGKLYFQRYFRYETSIAYQLHRIIQGEKTVLEEKKVQLIQNKALIESLFETNGNSTDWQLVAAIHAVLHNFTIITGGPGTGKTTTIAKVLAILYTIEPDIKVALAAPTGKASARMAESLRHAQLPDNSPVKELFARLEPSTIHRLLGYQKGSIYFRHDQSNPLDYDVIVIDECSMVDIALFAKLLQAIPLGTKIILLGDKDQLTSVEAGSLFGDLCKSLSPINEFSSERMAFVNSFIPNPLKQLAAPSPILEKNILFQHIVELQQSHRFDNEKGIGKLSHAVIHNDTEKLSHFFKNEDAQVFLDTENDPQTLQKFIDGYHAYIAEKDILPALKALDQLRVLCAVREGNDGVNNINRLIEKEFILRGWIEPNNIFYENRPIIVTQNNYNVGLFNGDIGLLRTDHQGVMRAWFVDNNAPDGSGIKSVLPGFIEKMDTVFAMTIHKSQGSEFDRVLVILPQDNSHQLLTRELLYTGITRAKKQVTVQASVETILETCSRSVQRASGIMERL